MSWYSDGEKFDEYDPPWCERCPHGDCGGDSYEECEACCRRHERKERGGGRAVKVKYIISYRELSTPMCTIKSVRFQVLPQSRFGRRWCIAELASQTFQLLLVAFYILCHRFVVSG